MDSYRQSCTFPKIEYVREKLRQANGLPPLISFAQEGMKDLLVMLEYLRHSFHESNLTEALHDFWAEKYFSNGYNYGPSDNEGMKTHHLLKSYSTLSEEEKMLEAYIAKVDIGNIHKTIVTHYPAAMVDIPRLSKEQLLARIQGTAITQVLCRLALDESFILAASATLGRTWFQVEQAGLLPLAASLFQNTLAPVNIDDAESLSEHVRVTFYTLLWFLKFTT